MSSSTIVALVAAILALVLLSGTCEAQTLSQFVTQKAANVQALAQSARLMHNTRCSKTCPASNCQVPACGDSFPESKNFHCNASYGLNAGLCGGSCGGLVRSMTEGVVRISPGADFGNGELQAFTCASKDLDSAFITQKNAGLTAWQYMGSQSGGIRIFPGNPQDRDTGATGTCSLYDPRQRPWYIAASSGPKDIVLVIDNSDSMEVANSLFTDPNFSRLDAAKAAVNAILGTLTQNDYFGVVAYGTTSVKVTGTTLRQASAAQISSAQSLVNNLGFNGDTHMEEGFADAFELLTSSTERTSGCSKIILFLTDGAATNAAAVEPAIATGQASLGANQAYIFTYSMSTQADDTLPKRIACGNNGVWARIADGQDPLTQMSQYYQFLAAGLGSANSATVRWTNPYIDDFGLGQMVTAAAPVYDTSLSLPLLVGVVGTDITMAELTRFGATSQVQAEIIRQGASCPAFNLTACQMQFLRGRDSECPAPAKSLALCESQNEVVTQVKCNSRVGGLNGILCESLDTTSRRTSSSGKSNRDTQCCSSCLASSKDDSSSSSATVGIAVGVSVGVVVIIVIIVLVVKRRDTAGDAFQGQSDVNSDIKSGGPSTNGTGDARSRGASVAQAAAPPPSTAARRASPPPQAQPVAQPVAPPPPPPPAAGPPQYPPHQQYPGAGQPGPLGYPAAAGQQQPPPPPQSYGGVRPLGAQY